MQEAYGFWGATMVQMGFLDLSDRGASLDAKTGSLASTAPGWYKLVYFLSVLFFAILAGRLILYFITRVY